MRFLILTDLLPCLFQISRCFCVLNKNPNEGGLVHQGEGMLKVMYSESSAVMSWERCVLRSVSPGYIWILESTCMQYPCILKWWPPPPYHSIALLKIDNKIDENYWNLTRVKCEESLMMQFDNLTHQAFLGHVESSKWFVGIFLSFKIYLLLAIILWNSYS